MNQEELKVLLNKYLKDECSDGEKELLDAFFASYTHQNQWIPWDEENPEQYETDLLIDIKKAIQQKEREEFNIYPIKSKVWLNRAASIAIVIGLGIFAFWAYSNFSGDQQEIAYITKTTEFGQKSNIVLSDGSEVRLNAGSILTFPEEFEGNTRQVSLIGEAFFKVQHNPEKPFIIESRGITTTVLGTSFNIQAYPEDKDVKVTVATGKVRVEEAIQPDHNLSKKKDAEGKTVFLTPSQQAVYHKETNSLEMREVDINRFLAWKEDIIRFDDIPIKEAVKILERWFNVTIKLENEAIGDCYISNTFRNENLVNILESVKFIKGNIDYSFQSPNEILITGTCEP